MLTDMMNSSYNGISTANASLECMLSISQYSPLETQVAELEDPPETLHMPWGTWRHSRDMLHSIDEKYDAEHVVRKGLVAEDILHNAHYVPVIGEDNHKGEHYEMNLDYNDLEELKTYNSKINLEYSTIDFEEELEDKKIPINEETEDDSIDLEKNIEEEPTEIPEKKLNPEDEMELVRLFEELLKF